MAAGVHPVLSECGWRPTRPGGESSPVLARVHPVGGELAGRYFPPTGDTRTQNPSSPCISRPRATSVRRHPGNRVHFPPTGDTRTQNPSSPRTSPAHGQHRHTATRAIAYISRPRAASAHRHQGNRAHLPPTGGNRAPPPGRSRALPAHGRHRHTATRAFACTSRPRAGTVRKTPAHPVHLPPTGGNRAPPPGRSRALPAHGRQPYAKPQLTPYISRPRATSARCHPGIRVHFPPTGGIGTPPPGQSRTSPAHGRQPYAKPQLPPYTSRPRAASAHRHPGNRVHFPPTGGKRPGRGPSSGTAEQSATRSRSFPPPPWDQRADLARGFTCARSKATG